MKATLCPLLLLAAASALELQAESELPNTWTYTNKYESARNYNRLRSRTQGAGLGDIVDRMGWATGTPATFTTANSNWFGGCRFKAGEMYEEFMNELGPNGDATHNPRHSNRRVAGIATYRCEDNGGNADGGTNDCYFAANARGFVWDHIAIDQAIGGAAVDIGVTKLTLYSRKPYNPTGADYRPEQTELTKWCTVPGIGFDLGRTRDVAINQFQADAPVTPATGTYRYSHFLTEEVKFGETIDHTAVNWTKNDADNFRADGVILRYHATIPFNTANMLLKTYNNKDWADLYGQTWKQAPNIACCMFETWPKRSYIRAKNRIAAQRTAACDNTALVDKSLTCVPAPVPL